MKLNFIKIFYFTVYYDVPGTETMGRQEISDIELFMNFTDRFAATRLWEIRIAQIPFSQRAPSGCLQYFTSANGIIQVLFLTAF